MRNCRKKGIPSSFLYLYVIFLFSLVVYVPASRAADGIFSDICSSEKEKENEERLRKSVADDVAKCRHSKNAKNDKINGVSACENSYKEAGKFLNTYLPKRKKICEEMQIQRGDCIKLLKDQGSGGFRQCELKTYIGFQKQDKEIREDLARAQTRFEESSKRNKVAIERTKQDMAVTDAATSKPRSGNGKAITLEDAKGVDANGNLISQKSDISSGVASENGGTQNMYEYRKTAPDLISEHQSAINTLSGLSSFIQEESEKRKETEARYKELAASIRKEAVAVSTINPDGAHPLAAQSKGDGVKSENLGVQDITGNERKAANDIGGMIAPLAVGAMPFVAAYMAGQNKNDSSTLGTAVDGGGQGISAATQVDIARATAGNTEIDTAPATASADSTDEEKILASSGIALNGESLLTPAQSSGSSKLVGGIKGSLDKKYTNGIKKDGRELASKPLDSVSDGDATASEDGKAETNEEGVNKAAAKKGLQMDGASFSAAFSSGDLGGPIMELLSSETDPSILGVEKERDVAVSSGRGGSTMVDDAEGEDALAANAIGGANDDPLFARIRAAHVRFAKVLLVSHIR